jgi:ssDNA-binding Zn-finger/Zn-ribbon topoisomerase 1
MSNTSPVQTNPPYCPRCGAKMILTRPKPSQMWTPFWRCYFYPSCPGIRYIKEDGTIEPDEDLGDYLDDDD